MAKAIAEIRSLARVHTEAALKCLVGVMNKLDAPESARVAAANSILDRGWGKPTQPIEATINDERDLSELSTAELLARTTRILADAEAGDRGTTSGQDQPPDVRKLN